MTGEDHALAPRSCLVCLVPCTSEGQLCPECVATGHRVTDATVEVNLEVRLPGWMT